MTRYERAKKDAAATRAQYLQFCKEDALRWLNAEQNEYGVAKAYASLVDTAHAHPLAKDVFEKASELRGEGLLETVDEMNEFLDTYCTEMKGLFDD